MQKKSIFWCSVSVLLNLFILFFYLCEMKRLALLSMIMKRLSCLIPKVSTSHSFKVMEWQALMGYTLISRTVGNGPVGIFEWMGEKEEGFLKKKKNQNGKNIYRKNLN